MNDPLWAFNLRFWIAIVALVAIAQWLTGCATVPVDRDHDILAVTDCHGKLRAVDVYYVANAAETCAKIDPWIALEMPLACADYERNIVIVSKGSPQWILAHELAHIHGMRHPPFLSFLQWSECE